MTDVPQGTAYRDSTGWRAELHWKDRGLRKRWRGRTKREAVAQMEKYRQELGAGLDPKDTTFSQMADIYLVAHKRTAKPATVAQAEWALAKAKPHIGHILVADLTPTDVEGVLHACEDDGLGPRSIRAIRGQMRSVMQRALRDRLVMGNVVDAIPGPKTPTKRLDLPAMEAVHDLLDQMKDEGHPSWPLLHLIASTAMRTGEARSLRWKDVARKNGVVMVRGQLDRDGNWSEPKTESGVRAIPLTPRAETALDEMQRRRDAAELTSIYVFAGSDGNPPAAWTGHKAWTRYQTRHWGKVRLTVHGLRHLAISALVAEGLPLPDAAKVAGHADSRILSEVYSHALDGHQQRVHEAMRQGGVG